MGEINNNIITLSLKYIDKLEEYTPEEILYALVKVSSLSDKALGYLLKEKKVEDTEEIRKEIAKIRTILEEKKLDPELLKDGLEELIPVVDGNKSSKNKLQKVTESYDESTTIEKIMSDLLSAIDEKELKLFVVGKDLKDIRIYRSELEKNLSNSDDFNGTADEEKKEADGPYAKKRKGGDKNEKPGGDEVPDSADPIDIELFPEKLKNYIKELEKITPVFADNGNVNLLWNRALLVSIDDGLGFTTFAKQIERIFEENGLVGKKYSKSIVTECNIVFDEREHEADMSAPSFERTIKEKGDIVDRKNIYSIFCVDLTKVCGQANDPKFRELLRSVDKYGDTSLVIFRVPYLERHVLAAIEATISDIVSVETIVVPPASIDSMIVYMQSRAKMYGYTFEKGCETYLEQGIIAEKNDGRFYGFRTLNNIVDSVIYKKIKDDASKKNPGTKITGKQLEGYIGYSEVVVDYEKKLSELIGVEEIIKQIDKAINQVKVSQSMSEKGNDVERPSIHMMFRGNPGTGKTTIARIVAQKMKSAGILKKGNFFEYKGRDLCAEYVGQTTPKTTSICRDAYGSVLFIDEAYELYRGGDSGKDYGREALTALVAEMENHRDDMCVIFAGYTDEMNTMVKGNPGLKSRIPIYIDFPNYDREQLEQIFFKMLEGKFKYEPGVKKAAHEFFSSLGDDVLKSKEFSNARFVRNLFESVWGEAALRFDLSSDGELKITESDFKTAIDRVDLKSMSEKKMGRIGFVI